MQAAEVGNPFLNWIGADIRSDPWAYAAPGWPEKAAELAHGATPLSAIGATASIAAMYFSAAISAAFAVNDPVEALQIGLQEIPADCLLAREVRWALDKAPVNRELSRCRRRHRRSATPTWAGRMPSITPYLTIWGLTVGGDDYSKVIGETVAMGKDNDCTAATAGSIWGAVYGKSAIPKHWYKNFNNKVHTFLYHQSDLRHRRRHRSLC